MKKILLLSLLIPLISIAQYGAKSKNYDEGYKYYNNGEFERCIVYFTRYINEAESYAKTFNIKNHSHLYIIRGASYKSIGEYEAAMEDYGKSIEIDDHILGYNNRAWILLKKEEYELAIIDFNITISRKSELIDMGWSDQDLGLIYSNRGFCKEKIQIDPCDDYKKACYFRYLPACEINCE